jgi:integrase
MSLKRNAAGDLILRFRTGGRGSALAYHNLGPLTLGAAKDREAEIRTEARRRRGLAEPGTTFANLAKTWTELVEPTHEESTNVGNAGMLNLHILPIIGSLRVEDLLPMTIERYRAARLAEKKPPAYSTVNLEVAVIKAVLNFGAKKRIVANPILRDDITKLPVPKIPKTIFFEQHEWAAFIEAADSDEELREAAPLWKLKLLTASRIGEMIGLRWSDVDFMHGVIAIRQPKTAKKGVAIKTLTLTADIRAVLATVTRGIGDTPVFTHAGEPWVYWRLYAYFEKTVKAAGLVGDWTPHSVRHSSATWARKAGVPLDRVAMMLGHAGLGLVLRYAHADTKDVDGALDAVSAMERRGV